MTIEESVNKIKELVFTERKIVNEFNSLLEYISDDKQENNMINVHIDKLKKLMSDTSKNLLGELEGTMVMMPLKFQEKLKKEEDKERREREIEEAKEMALSKEVEQSRVRGEVRIANESEDIRKKIKGGVAANEEVVYVPVEKEKMSELDKEVLKRLKKKDQKKEIKKDKKPSRYVNIASIIFGDSVKKMIKQKKLASLEKDLIKSNLTFTPTTYFSVLIFTTILSLAIAVLIFSFFLSFNISSEIPIIARVTENPFQRILKIFWILLVLPAGTFWFMYSYPSFEKKSLEGKINQELPFATIHMAAISSSLVEPTKIFKIICYTKEYPYLEKEFNKLLNEINIYGYDMVTALKNLSLNCPSPKLAELFNGLATTITSGGDLFDFFDKRSQTLLFEYRLDKEKQTKSAETFMDIYISVVIAAPMILMLLLMMMKISGLGLALSTSTITILVVGGVSIINVFFIVFLQLKNSSAA